MTIARRLTSLGSYLQYKVFDAQLHRLPSNIDFRNTGNESFFVERRLKKMIRNNYLSFIG